MKHLENYLNQLIAWNTVLHSTWAERNLNRKDPITVHESGIYYAVTETLSNAIEDLTGIIEFLYETN